MTHVTDAGCQERARPRQDAHPLFREIPVRIAYAIRTGFRASPAKRRLVGGPVSLHAAVVNGCPALLFVAADRVVGATVLEVRDGRIAGVRGIAAAARLDRLSREWYRRGHPDALIEAW
ncbi:hypothetical protein DXT66_03125 [Nocardia farcinica]|nr:hypothetical protein DXT66_03125 [Nocardia farcinica]